MHKLNYYIIILSCLLLLLNGCKLSSEKLYQGLGDSLRKTVKESLAEAKSIPEEAMQCKCMPTGIIALKQYVTKQTLKRQLFNITWSVVSGAITALPISTAAKAALKISIAAAQKADGYKFKGTFTQKVEWDQNPEFKINKLCKVEWFGFYNPKTQKVTVIINCECNGKKCVVKYAYNIDENGFMVGSANYTELK